MGIKLIMETTESNKLIAEFMGLIPVDNNDSLYWYQVKDEFYINKDFNYKNKVQYTTSDMLPYHLSWDWLMPVVKKIISIINGSDFESYNDWEDYYVVFNEVSFLELTLKDLYENVVEFIKWYNKQKTEIKMK
tara:strand:- start:40433 stop:40831 length:399 start_codon:yes stop_codon:yes gene_type:complete